MRRLIWGFAGRTYDIVGNLMHWLIFWEAVTAVRFCWPMSTLIHTDPSYCIVFTRVLCFGIREASCCLFLIIFRMMFWGVQLNFKISTLLSEYWKSLLWFWTNGKSDISKTTSVKSSKFVWYWSQFLDFDLSINNDTVSSNFFDKRDDFNYLVVYFPFLDEDVPLSILMVYVYLIRFTRVCSNVSDTKFW